MGTRLRRFARDDRGNVLATFAIAITVLLGAAGLGTEAASWYASKRDIQNTADLGAASGVLTLKMNYSSASSATDDYAKNEARSAATIHRYDASNSTVTVNIPPLSGSHTGSSYNHLAVEVVVQQPAPLLFSGLFLSSGPTIGARAVGLVDLSKGDCLAATNPTAAQAFQMTGSVNVNINCGVAVYSSATGNQAKNNAFYSQGSASLSATSITVQGGIGITGGGGSVTSANTQTGTAPPANPYDNWPVPAFTGCSSFGPDITTTQTLSPGVICSNINLSNATVTLSSGVYFLDQRSITLGSNSSLVSNGKVTIILTSSNCPTSTSCNNVGNFNMQSSGASVNLTAMNSGATAGMAIVQDPRATTATMQSNGNCATNCNSVQGGPGSSIVGAVYFKHGNLTYSGSPNTSSTGCLQIIADTLIWSGNPSLLVNACAGTGVTPFGPITAALVE